MRAAAALNWLVPVAREKLSSMISDRGLDEHVLVWLAGQKELLGIMQQTLGLFETCNKRLAEGATISCDLAILCLAPISNWREANELLSSKVQQCLMEMFDRGIYPGHTMACRWATLCLSLNMEGLVEDIVDAWRGDQDDFVPTLTSHLIGWLQGGHPYKAAGAKVLKVLAQNRHLHELALDAVSERADLVPERCQQEPVEYLQRAFESLCSQ
eukprot:TRINITY_DN54256_c0_g1_i3.p1 TRINITY_DN54256_c0_g1~~TRINITY_DN54256_c0_g1_i3.p1  ORF type:complete len:213 (-),score=44.68 TRINITY_DN54256_c0_g1_i3:230-868(-)